MADTLYYYAVGRRKTAIARVRLIPGGNGAVLVNGQPIAVYLQRSTHQAQAVLPLRVTDNLNKFNISAKVLGGGITGSRGHEGENAGELALIDLLDKGQAAQRGASVYGCPLFASGT